MESDLNHIALLREMIEDAEARIGELEARKGYHMTADQAEALDDQIDAAWRELHRVEAALYDDHGLTYEDGTEARLVPVNRTCADGLAALARIDGEFEGVAA